MEQITKELLTKMKMEEELAEMNKKREDRANEEE